MRGYYSDITFHPSHADRILCPRTDIRLEMSSSFHRCRPVMDFEGHRSNLGLNFGKVILRFQSNVRQHTRS